MKTKVRPYTAWAIVDGFDNTIMEQSGSGLLNIFYAKADADFAFAAVQQGCDAPTAKRLRIVEIRLSDL